MSTNSTLCQAISILERYHVPVEHITLGLDSFAFVASQTALGNSLYDILNEIQKTADTDDVQVQDNIALVAAVGRKMSFRPGTSGKLFNARYGNRRQGIASIAEKSGLMIILLKKNTRINTAMHSSVLSPLMWDNFRIAFKAHQNGVSFFY